MRQTAGTRRKGWPTARARPVVSPPPPLGNTLSHLGWYKCQPRLTGLTQETPTLRTSLLGHSPRPITRAKLGPMQNIPRAAEGIMGQSRKDICPRTPMRKRPMQLTLRDLLSNRTLLRTKPSAARERKPIHNTPDHRGQPPRVGSCPEGGRARGIKVKAPLSWPKLVGCGANPQIQDPPLKGPPVPHTADGRLIVFQQERPGQAVRIPLAIARNGETQAVAVRQAQTSAEDQLPLVVGM